MLSFHSDVQGHDRPTMHHGREREELLSPVSKKKKNCDKSAASNKKKTFNSFKKTLKKIFYQYFEKFSNFLTKENNFQVSASRVALLLLMEPFTDVSSMLALK